VAIGAIAAVASSTGSNLDSNVDRAARRIGRKHSARSLETRQRGYRAATACRRAPTGPPFAAAVCSNPIATTSDSSQALQPLSPEHQNAVPASTLPAPDAPSTPTAVAPLSAASPATAAIAAISRPDCTMVKPPYPPMSRRLQEAGTAIVQLIIDERGTIESARVVRSSGYWRLDDAARDAVLASTCSPYIVNGAAKRATAAVPFTFGFTN
jgi:periplasmic protein TonB